MPIEAKVSGEEAKDVLRRIADGEPLKRITPMTDAGNVKYKIGGYCVTVFMDGGGFDYVEAVVAPDGRRGQFDDWQQEGMVSAPECMLNRDFGNECYFRMEAAFQDAD